MTFYEAGNSFIVAVSDGSDPRTNRVRIPRVFVFDRTLTFAGTIAPR